MTRGRVLSVVAVLVVVGLGTVIGNWAAVQHWISHVSGAQPAGTRGYNPVFYNWWSGPGSDLGEVTLIGAVLGSTAMAFRKINCHAKGCPRIGKHAVEGTPYHVCAKHHPDVPDGGASVEHIHAHHARAKAGPSGTRRGKDGRFIKDAPRA